MQDRADTVWLSQDQCNVSTYRASQFYAMVSYQIEICRWHKSLMLWCTHQCPPNCCANKGHSYPCHWGALGSKDGPRRAILLAPPEQVIFAACARLPPKPMKACRYLQPRYHVGLPCASPARCGTAVVSLCWEPHTGFRREVQSAAVKPEY